MNATTQAPSSFAGSIPTDYDRYLVPFLFEDFADDLVDRLQVPAGGRVLEIACGTGVVTERLSKNTQAAEIVATDFSDFMLKRAVEQRGELTGVRFQQADALELPFEDAGFDAICSQFGLMFFSDKQRALDEALRVLKPGGRLAFNVWDDYDSNPYVRVVQDVIAHFFDEDPPTFLEQPWGFSALEPLKYLVNTAGFDDVELNIVSHVSEDCSPLEIAKGLVLGTPTITEIETRCATPAQVVVEAVAAALAQRFGDAPCRVPKREIVVTAQRPL